MRKVEVCATDAVEPFVKKQIVFEKDKNDEKYRINVYPDIKRQEILGFGGAVTESSAYVLMQLSEEKQNEILDAYFAPEGNRYQLCRLPIQSCDFALGNYSYIEDETDKALSSFTIERDKRHLIPFIHEVMKRNPSLSFIASPWSPPAFMKTNGTMNFGGKLLPEYMQMWADMYVKYMKEYEKEGITIRRITVQNEPEATQTWDSCTYTGIEEGRFVVDYLKPTLEKSGLGHVKILIWDHNKEAMLDRVRETFVVEGAKDAVDGVAFHWYTGDHFDAVALTKEMYPNMELLFTEGCVEFSRFSQADEVSHAEMYAHDILGNLNAGMNGYTDWNLILDHEGGPNHVHNFCSAPIMCEIKEDKVRRNLSYYYIGHFSRFILPGAKCIATTKYTDKLEVCAFLNINHTIVLVVLNRSNEELNIHVKEHHELFEDCIKAHSIKTFIWGCII